MMDRTKAARWVGIGTAIWVVFMLASLHFGWLNAFTFDTSHAHVQGIDFFPVERGWLNLTQGRSEYDTFNSSYGPYATWLLYHPVLAIVIGPFLMAFSAFAAYGAWTCISVLLMAFAAWIIAKRTADPLQRALIFLLLLGAFPTFLMLFVGNIQSILVLAFTLILVAIDTMRNEGVTKQNQTMLLAGLLLSLFSKPAVFAMMPLLLLLKETRRSTLRALGIYIVVSFLCLSVPAINPEPMPWSQRMELATHPDVIEKTMNVYTNGFTITQPMKDNAIHWLVLLEFSQYRLMHVDVYSLSAFLDGLTGTRTPDALYTVPVLFVLEMTLVAFLIRDRTDRLEAALMTLMASTLLLFLSYPLVWEYLYAGALPVAAIFLTRSKLDRIEKTILAMGIILWLPTLYIFLRNQNAADVTVQTWIRLSRVVPVTVMFFLLVARTTLLALRSKCGLRFLTK